MTFDVFGFTDMSVQTDNKDVLCELIIYLTIKMVLLYYTSLVEILCVLKEKLVLFVGNPCMMCMLWKFCYLTLPWTS